jgi:hypothetical protein
MIEFIREALAEGAGEQSYMDAVVQGLSWEGPAGPGQSVLSPTVQ